MSFNQNRDSSFGSGGFGGAELGELADVFLPGLRNMIQQRASRVPAAPQPVHRPRSAISIDIVNTEEVIYVYAELPGVAKEHIDVDFYNNKLTIVADKTCPYQEPDLGEIAYGRVERTITLPICVTKSDTVSVIMKNGILCIRINKLVEEANKFKVVISDEKETTESIL